MKNKFIHNYDEYSVYELKGNPYARGLIRGFNILFNPPLVHDPKWNQIILINNNKINNTHYRPYSTHISTTWDQALNIGDPHSKNIEIDLLFKGLLNHNPKFLMGLGPFKVKNLKLNSLTSLMDFNMFPQLKNLCINALYHDGNHIQIGEDVNLTINNFNSKQMIRVTNNIFTFNRMIHDMDEFVHMMGEQRNICLSETMVTLKEMKMIEQFNVTIDGSVTLEVPKSISENIPYVYEDFMVKNPTVELVIVDDVVIENLFDVTEDVVSKNIVITDKNMYQFSELGYLNECVFLRNHLYIESTTGTEGDLNFSIKFFNDFLNEWSDFILGDIILDQTHRKFFNIYGKLHPTKIEKRNGKILRIICQ